MKINHNQQRAWQSYDPESVTNKSGGVNHGASVVRNLRAMGEDTLHAVLPLDRTITFAAAAATSGPTALRPIFVFFALLTGLVFDILELLALPFALVKNTADIAAHGVAAGVNAVKGESDGEASPVDAYRWNELPSMMRQISGAEYTTPKLDAPKAKGVSVS